MPRRSRLTTTAVLSVLAGAALFAGSRWSLASPIEPRPMPPCDRPPTVEPVFAPVPHPRIDVAFVVDTTGSMADEIAVVKDKVADMAREITAGQPTPEVRFALVCYRDRGDAYVTQTFPFTTDVEALERAIRQVDANGGGDTPESVNAALHAAVSELAWDEDPRVSRQVFLIGDAGPHMDYANDHDYRAVARLASDRRIAIDTISCSGMDGFGTTVWRQIASATNGNFEHLTYARAMVQEDGSVKTYLEAGGRVYTPAPDVADDEWRAAGAAGLVGGDRADEIAPGDETGRQVGKLENNLDSVMVQRLKARAEAEQGVAYSD